MDIRAEFLSFFESKNHKKYESMPLVPDDPTLLFTNAGMVQFKDVFTGTAPTPQDKRATSSQLCVRAGGKHNDLENVGYTRRHHTLFEMLGNFSFGDYFKEEAIDFAWEFVTKNIGLPKEKLYVSVFEDDDEAFKLWEKHLPSSKIKRMGEKDNFWQMGETGACGPCSEIYFDQGDRFSSSEDYFGGDGDRFLEIWNLVFMQFDRDKEGRLNPLPKPSIDTGMGLERVQAILEGVDTNFHSSLFMPIIKNVEDIVKKPYTYEEGASFRVIADHIRATVFLLSQGVNFDKEGRGYVLRRILRRAIRHGYLLGLREPFMHKIVPALISIMKSAYPYLTEKESSVKESIYYEEERFFATISDGMELFKRELELTKGKLFSGDTAFRLYDTYGFPLDLTQDMLRDLGMGVDLDGFEMMMSEQRKRSSASWKGSGDSSKSAEFGRIAESCGKNEFVGYITHSVESKIKVLLDSDINEVQALEAGVSGEVVFEKTPFYAESGGQVGDVGGIFLGEEKVAEVVDTKKVFDLNVSTIKVYKKIDKDTLYTLKVSDSRKEIARHHSATHILHKVLKDSLGEHISQAGSLVEDGRLRFDFNHPRALRQEELKEIEYMVNRFILEGCEADIFETSIDEAKKLGATALFGEKYGDVVRVVRFGDFSMELCGGTHVKNVSEIGSFYILKESGVSAGVRRIEAVCGEAAYLYAKGFINLNGELRDELRSQDLLEGVRKLKEQIKELKNELKNSQNSTSKELQPETLNGVSFVVSLYEGKDIKSAIDEFKNRFDSAAIMLFQVKDEKVTIAAGSKNCNIKAGAWVKEIAKIVGGNGGGRDDFAQAGGKDAQKVEEAKIKAQEYAKSLL